MPKSELGKKITKAINAVEEFISDMQKDTIKILNALRELEKTKEDNEE